MQSPKKTGTTLSVARIKRKQKRKKRRLVEAVDQDWERWDAAATYYGLNWAEFARRSMNRSADAADLAIRIKGLTGDLSPMPRDD
jgi:hypothetical protein